MRSFLWRQQLADQSFFDEVEAQAETLAIRLREGCRSMPDPDPDIIFRNVYAEPHRQVAQERATFAAYLDSFVPLAPAAGQVQA